MQAVVLCSWLEISTEKAKKKEETAEEAIAIVVTQTYDYMIEQGLSFGYCDGVKAEPRSRQVGW